MLKEYARQRGVEVSRLLEELIVDELVEKYIGEALGELAGSSSYEIDFNPVRPHRGSKVSDLVRVMRDERAHNLSRQ